MISWPVGIAGCFPQQYADIPQCSEQGACGVQRLRQTSFGASKLAPKSKRGSRSYERKIGDLLVMLDGKTR